MTNYKRVKAYWEAFSSAIEDDEIELQNLLLEKIEEKLPFKDEVEHNNWLNVSDTFKFWEDFEDLTINIIKRLKGERKYV